MCERCAYVTRAVLAIVFEHARTAEKIAPHPESVDILHHAAECVRIMDAHETAEAAGSALMDYINTLDTTKLIQLGKFMHYGYETLDALDDACALLLINRAAKGDPIARELVVGPEGSEEFRPEPIDIASIFRGAQPRRNAPPVS